LTVLLLTNKTGYKIQIFTENHLPIHERWNSPVTEPHVIDHPSMNLKSNEKYQSYKTLSNPKHPTLYSR